MNSIRDETIALYNSTLEQLKQRFPGNTEATLIYFGTRARLYDPRYPMNVHHAVPGVEVRYQNVPLSNLRPMTRSDYVPQDNTPMFDGIATAIHRMESDDPEVCYYLAVISDGEENASVVYPKSDMGKIRQLIVDKQGTDRWTIAVMIQRDYVEKFRALGAVPDGNIMAWGDIKQAEQAAVASVGNYATIRAAGQRSTRQVFTTDLSGITKRDISSLREITHEVKTWKVDSTMRIDHFLNAKQKGGFRPGVNFYALQKKERLQADKNQFIISEKGTKRFYVCDRNFLGMPPGEIKLDPGNHANLDIYCLSTSNNRNLLAGSRVIVWPGADKASVHLHGVNGQATP